MAYDGVAAKFTVSGSIISCLTTLSVLVYCLATRGRHRSIRHALVFNLVLAGEFLCFAFLSLLHFAICHFSRCVQLHLLGLTDILQIS